MDSQTRMMTMTLPKHPLLRALLALWGALFMLGMLLVGLLLGAVLMLWVGWRRWRGRHQPVPASDVPWAPGGATELLNAWRRRGRAPARQQGDVVEGEAREVR